MPNLLRVRNPGIGAIGAAGVALTALMVSLAGCGSSGVDLSNDKGPTPGVPSNLPTATPATAHSGPTAKQFEAALLTTPQLNKLKVGAFTSTPVEAASTTSTGCAALDVFNDASKAAKPRVTIAFEDKASKLSAEEDITLLPDTSDTLFGALKDGINSCPTITVDGSRLALQVLDDPEVDGADDTLAVQATATVAGQPFTVNIEMARFADTVLSTTFGGPLTTSQANRGMNAFFGAALSRGLTVVTS